LVDPDLEGPDPVSAHRHAAPGEHLTHAQIRRAAYVARRTAEGKTKAEIIRCLKRHLAREIWALMRPLRTASLAIQQAS